MQKKYSKKLDTLGYQKIYVPFPTVACGGFGNIFKTVVSKYSNWYQSYPSPYRGGAIAFQQSDAWAILTSSHSSSLLK